jgi:hypothetical protein
MDKPGFYVFVEPKYIKEDEGAEAVVPMCHACYSSSGSKAPDHSYATFRVGDPTHCDAARAELKPLTFIEKVILAPVRTHNFLLVIKEQVDMGRTPRVVGNTIAFPMVEAVGAGDFSHLGHLFNEPHKVKEFVRVQLLDPKGNFDVLRERLLGSKELLCRPAVLRAWLHLFRVGNPRMWKLPLAHLKVGANEATMQGLRDELCSALDCISETSKHGLAFTAREASDVAGVREGELPPQADIFGTALPPAQSPAPPAGPEAEDLEAPLCPTMHFLEVAPTPSIGGMPHAVEAAVHMIYTLTDLEVQRLTY